MEIHLSESVLTVIDINPENLEHKRSRGSRETKIHHNDKVNLNIETDYFFSRLMTAVIGIRNIGDGKEVVKNPG